MEIKNNISIGEGVIRLLIGLLIAVVGAVFNSWIGVLAIIPIVSSMAGWCPVYSLMNKSTATSSSDFSSH